MFKRVTYLVMKKEDRLTLNQARAVLKALTTVDVETVLSGQDKPNLRIAMEKLEEAVEQAAYQHDVRSERDQRIAKGA
jgi:uncharacterized ferredoxin-like protein